MSPLLSVIVPVYKVEPYIRKCLASIQNQSLKDFECIIVDDGSPDNSIQTCNEFAFADSRLKVIHKQNEGLPMARRTGYENASGKYLLFIDSDDFLEPDMFELMVNAAEQNNAHVTVCDFYRDFADHKECVSYTLPKDKFSQVKFFTKRPGYMNYFWNKLFLKSFFDSTGVTFPKGISLCEDLFVTFKLVYLSEKTIQVQKPLYHYNRANVTSMTNNFNQKSYQDRMTATNEILDFLKQGNPCPNCSCTDFSSIENFYKLYTKLMLVLVPSLHNEQLWKETFPEANKYVWKTSMKFRHKLLTWLCSKGLFKTAYFLRGLS